MEELIKLKTFCESKVEKAQELYNAFESDDPNDGISLAYSNGREEAFSEVIEQLDLILNNSVVKPSERRSLTDESFNGCKPPDERQNPLEYKIL